MPDLGKDTLAAKSIFDECLRVQEYRYMSRKDTEVRLRECKAYILAKKALKLVHRENERCNISSDI
jgi:hypothetical protein